MAFDYSFTSLTMSAADLFGGVEKSALNGLDNLLAEFGIVAAGFGLELHFIGDNIGGCAAVNETDIAGAASIAFYDWAVPAFCVQPGDGEPGNGDGAYAELRSGTGVAGQTFDIDLHAVAAGCADGNFFRGAAIPIEGQFGLAEQI